MGFFGCISRRADADSEAAQKHDSQPVFSSEKVRIFRLGPPADPARQWQTDGELQERAGQQFGIFRWRALFATARAVHFG